MSIPTHGWQSWMQISSYRGPASSLICEELCRSFLTWCDGKGRSPSLVDKIRVEDIELVSLDSLGWGFSVSLIVSIAAGVLSLALFSSTFSLDFMNFFAAFARHSTSYDLLCRDLECNGAWECLCLCIFHMLKPRVYNRERGRVS